MRPKRQNKNCSCDLLIELEMHALLVYLHSLINVQMYPFENSHCLEMESLLSSLELSVRALPPPLVLDLVRYQ